MPNSDDDRDGRSAAARGYVIAMRVTSIGLQMAVPPSVGMWLDSRYAIAPWATVAGVVLGFSTSMMELLKMSRDSDSTPPPQR